MSEIKLNSYLEHLPTERVNDNTYMLDSLNGTEIARLMNEHDAIVAGAVQKAVPTIGRAIELIANKLANGGRLFYIGAGTSGRLGVLDASECPPTFGVSPELVQGIIAGGDEALRTSAEDAEDEKEQGAKDLKNKKLSDKDVVVSISTSGYTPYCIGALSYAKDLGALAISVTCNENTLLSAHSDISIEVLTGPEVLMGSTRLKGGTAIKMVLNMLSTGSMVRMGKVYRNLMVDLRITNKKLSDRALRIICHATGIPPVQAYLLLNESKGNVKAAIVMNQANVSLEDAETALEESDGWVSSAIENLL